MFRFSFSRTGGLRSRRRPYLLLSVVLVAALVFAACGAAAPEPTATPLSAADTPVPAPTDTPVPAPTDTPVPAPTSTPVAPTDTPVSQEPTAEPTEEPEIVPSVSVQDQELVDGTVSIAEVVSAGPGWIVIHAQAEGAPGPVVGYAAVVEGVNAGVVVQVDPAGATETLYAMLHTDAGEIGTYEFPGADVPATVEGQVITPAFQVTGGLAAEPRIVNFALVPEGSEARFLIDEVLFGNPKTVIGVTSDVDGEIAINMADYPDTSISAIRINARDLTTDNNFRNNAIRRFILQTNQDQYQYIVFEPTAINGLPSDVVMGDPFSFTVTGDLTIRDITRPVTFEVNVTPASETELSGSATTVIQRADFALEIPDVEGVANVSEQVGIAFDFTARAVQ